MQTFDLGEKGLRALHEELHAQAATTNANAAEVASSLRPTAILVIMVIPLHSLELDLEAADKDARGTKVPRGRPRCRLRVRPAHTTTIGRFLH